VVGHPGAAPGVSPSQAARIAVFLVPAPAECSKILLHGSLIKIAYLLPCPCAATQHHAALVLPQAWVVLETSPCWLARGITAD